MASFARNLAKDKLRKGILLKFQIDLQFTEPWKY
jgi:hypothetical protein